MPITARSPSRRTHSWSLVKRSSVMAMFLLRRSTGLFPALPRGPGRVRVGAVVMVGDKRQRDDARRGGRAPHQQGGGADVRGMGGIDIAHRDRAADRRAKAAAGDPADLVA